MVVERARMRFSLERYEQMVEAGVLTKDDRVELLDGEIVEMASVGVRHQAVIDRLTHLFVTRAGDVVIVRVQGPLRLPPRSEPEPDVLLLERRDDFYNQQHPGAAAAFLVIEVADSSVRFDRTVKFPIYARSGVREAWLVDLTTDVIEVHRSPTTDGYADVSVFERGSHITPGALPDVRVLVDDILG